MEHPTMTDPTGGWIDSARAYINFQDAEDPNRTLLLDPIMLDLCGDVAGKRVLDLGCGEGRFCRMLAERGALCTGIDLISEMARIARSRDASPNRYAIAEAARLPFRDASFDLAVSYVTLVDIPDFRGAIAECTRVLRPGGAIVVANLGFCTANALPNTGWVRDQGNKRVHYAIDHYADERGKWYEWVGIRIENWHRPLSSYMQAYLSAGLVLTHFDEPVPADDSLRDDPHFEDWYRIPMFTTMRWLKPRRAPVAALAEELTAQPEA
jgi:SAM-dependent methyltransferase